MSLIIWIIVLLFFGAILRTIYQEARKPAPPPAPPPKEPDPPIFNTYVQMNTQEHFHTHNTMNVTVVKATPTEDPGGKNKL